MASKRSGWWDRLDDLNNVLDLVGWKSAGVCMITTLSTYDFLINPQNRLLTVGVALLAGIFVAALSIWWQMRRRPNFPTVPFFRNRSELDDFCPLAETFADGNIIDAYFLRGDGIFRGLTTRYAKVRRLMFPKDTAPSLKVFADPKLSTSSAYRDYPNEIKRAISDAATNKVQELKVCEEFIGMTILMCNPDEVSGWMHISLAMPYLQHEHRPTIRIEKEKHEEAFNNIRKAFDVMFREGSKP